MYDRDDLIALYMSDNSERRKRQKAACIRVILGNPPYSVSQGSFNDEVANAEYPALDARILEAYAERSTSANQHALCDCSIGAILSASDRVSEEGIIACVTNAVWVGGAANKVCVPVWVKRTSGGRSGG